MSERAAVLDGWYFYPGRAVKWHVVTDASGTIGAYIGEVRAACGLKGEVCDYETVAAEHVSVANQCRRTGCQRAFSLAASRTATGEDAV